MKKILAFALCAVLLSALAVPVMAQQISITAPKGTPSAINGTFEPDVYSDWFVFAHSDGDNIAGGRIAFAWDDDHLYFFVEVNDTTPHHDNPTDWQTDNVEFFIDWNNHRGTGIQNDGQPFWQARIHSAPGVNNFSVTGHANERWTPPDFQAINHVVVPLSGNNLNNGYIIEAAFPRSAVEGGMTLTEGMVLGFGAAIGDAHNDSERAGTSTLIDAASYGMETNMWQNPSALQALLTLGAAPAPPPPLAADEPAPAGADPTPTPQAQTPATAPRTFDPVALAALGALAAGAGVVIAKKRK